MYGVGVYVHVDFSLGFVSAGDGWWLLAGLDGVNELAGLALKIVRGAVNKLVRSLEVRSLEVRSLEVRSLIGDDGSDVEEVMIGGQMDSRS